MQIIWNLDHIFIVLSNSYLSTVGVPFQELFTFSARVCVALGGKGKCGVVLHALNAVHISRKYK